jgi:hypothetical protein
MNEWIFVDRFSEHPPTGLRRRSRLPLPRSTSAFATTIEHVDDCRIHTAALRRPFLPILLLALDCSTTTW